MKLSEDKSDVANLIIMGGITCSHIYEPASGGKIVFSYFLYYFTVCSRNYDLSCCYWKELLWDLSSLKDAIPIIASPSNTPLQRWTQVMHKES